MMSFSRAALKTATKSPASAMTKMMRQAAPARAFSTTTDNHRNLGNELNRDLFEHKFTSEMDFQSSFDKIKCFRIMDEEGNVITPGYEDKVSDKLLLEMYDKMVTMNEVDQVYNAA